MKRMIEGFVHFRNKVFPQQKERFAELAKGQQPEVLLITCSDSRIDPNLVTQTNPGDLFIVRNAGNIVPPHGGPVGGITATVEFGVVVLKCKHIVVCGHTHCGAMKGALNTAALDNLPHVRDWLDFSRAAVEVVKRTHPHLPPDELQRAVTEQNVLVQLTNLRTHPAVASRLAAKEVQLHGWIYEFESGTMLAHDERSNTFLPLEQVYRDMLDG